MKALVVGAGFSGCVAAERLAAHGHEVLVLDKREHIAGNAFDRYDFHGILIHEYGPHVFHTNHAPIEEYISRFTSWYPYEHKTLSNVRGKLLPMPINLTTINLLYGTDFDEKGLREFFDKVRERRDKIVSSEDYLLNLIGRELTDIFYSGYVKKQWGVELSELSASVVSRIPIRTTNDSRYFTDVFQGVPKNGYVELFTNMLHSPRIRVELGATFRRGMEDRYDLLVYTGALDEYFGYSLGKLPYRSLVFRHEHHRETTCQSVGSVVHPSLDVPYTRITEHKHLTGQNCKGTTVSIEYPSAVGDPYYPVPHERNRALYAQYAAMAAGIPKLLPIGRLAQYQYLNMDQAVGSALNKIERRLR